VFLVCSGASRGFPGVRRVARGSWKGRIVYIQITAVSAPGLRMRMQGHAAPPPSAAQPKRNIRTPAETERWKKQGGRGAPLDSPHFAVGSILHFLRSDGLHQPAGPAAHPPCVVSSAGVDSSPLLLGRPPSCRPVLENVWRVLSRAKRSVITGVWGRRRVSLRPPVSRLRAL